MIYVITDGEYYKIGFTAGDPLDRMRSLQTGNARRLRLLYTVVGEMDHERTLHRRYDSKRLEGEWFRLDSGDMTEISTTFVAFPKLASHAQVPPARVPTYGPCLRPYKPVPVADLPRICVAQNYAEMVEQAGAVLATIEGIYQHYALIEIIGLPDGGRIVRRLRPINARVLLSSRAYWYKVRGGREVQVRPDHETVSSLLAQGQWPGVPHLGEDDIDLLK